MADAASAPRDPHDRHDPLAVAQAARPGRSPVAARGWVRTCAPCARLHDDIALILAALPHAGTPPRTRDFTLARTQADRLRRRGLLALLAGIGTARDAVTRPLAVGFTTLGLAGLLVAASPVGLPAMGGDGASLAPESDIMAAAAPTAPAASADVMGGAPPADGGGDRRRSTGSSLPTAGPPEPSPLHVLSGSFLGLGVSLFGLRRLAALQRVR